MTELDANTLLSCHTAVADRNRSTPIGNVGALLIHGFTGAPGEVSELGTALQARGYQVEMPLLAGHGGSQELLAASTWREWVESAETGLRRLRTRCDCVVVVGFSLGGVIALHMAARESFAGLVSLAAPTHIDNPLIHIVPVARFLLPYWYPLKRLNLSNPRVVERLRTYMPDMVLDWSDPKQLQTLRRSVRVSLHAVHQVQRLLRVTRPQLPGITAPILMIQARDDEQIPVSSIDNLYREVGSSDKERVYVEHPGHVLTIGPAKHEVFGRVVSFVLRVAPVAAPAMDTAE